MCGVCELGGGHSSWVTQPGAYNVNSSWPDNECMWYTPLHRQRQSCMLLRLVYPHGFPLLHGDLDGKDKWQYSWRG